MSDHTPVRRNENPVKLRFRRRHEVYAALWDKAGRPADMLETSHWFTMQMRLWMSSDGARYEEQKKPISPLVHEFIDACSAALDASEPGWYDKLLSGRSYCEYCAQPWLYENLYFCTDCMALYCIDCIGRYPYYKNGNRRCSCEGEIVG